LHFRFWGESLLIRVVIEREKVFGGERRTVFRVSDWAETIVIESVCVGSRESEGRAIVGVEAKTNRVLAKDAHQT